jgi:ABC-type sulfate transport system permease component
MYILIIMISSVIILSLFIALVLSSISKRKDELGRVILERALSRSMLLTLGILFLSTVVQLLRSLLNSQFFSEKMNIGSLFIVALLIVLSNLKIENGKYK